MTELSPTHTFVPPTPPAGSLSAGPPIAELSAELVLSIFERLSWGDQFTASRVCREWRAIAAHPCLRRLHRVKALLQLRAGYQVKKESLGTFGAGIHLLALPRSQREMAMCIRSHGSLKLGCCDPLLFKINGTRRADPFLVSLRAGTLESGAWVAELSTSLRIHCVQPSSKHSTYALDVGQPFDLFSMSKRNIGIITDRGYYSWDASRPTRPPKQLWCPSDIKIVGGRGGVHHVEVRCLSAQHPKQFFSLLLETETGSQTAWHSERRALPLGEQREVITYKKTREKNEERAWLLESWSVTKTSAIRQWKKRVKGKSKEPHFHSCDGRIAVVAGNITFLDRATGKICLIQKPKWDNPKICLAWLEDGLLEYRTDLSQPCRFTPYHVSHGRSTLSLSLKKSVGLNKGERVICVAEGSQSLLFFIGDQHADKPLRLVSVEASASSL